MAASSRLAPMRNVSHGVAAHIGLSARNKIAPEIKMGTQSVPIFYW
jgi:hypothetical protein